MDLFSPGAPLLEKEARLADSRLLASFTTHHSIPVPARLRRRLLQWFARHARDLPWRRTRDPYAIWVSEIMLQQTQVATVIPYYHRFLSAFPTVAALAAASAQDVLRLWEGLGYYRRAHGLHQAARLMVERHQGQVPQDPESLRALPGLGRYTVGAILSQGFDQRLPILEANSQRVWCRLLAIAEDPRTSKVQKKLWAAAEAYLPHRAVGDFNQAMMELGALVCKPVGPKCGECPLRQDCQAFQQGKQGHIPVTRTRPKVEEVREIVLVIQRRGQQLLVQRPAHGRWGGLWEFPHLAMHDGEEVPEAAQRLLKALKIEAVLEEKFAQLRHGITRFRLHLHCRHARHRSGRFQAGDWVKGVWINLRELRNYPLSVPQRRLANLLIAQTV